MTRRSRSVFGLALVAVLAAGCAGDSEPAAAEDDVTATSPAEAAVAVAVPWERVETLLAATRGSYQKIDEVTSGPERATLVDETVRFDLDAPYVERELEFPDAEEITGEALPGGGSLRFIATDDVLLLWNGVSTQTCGVPWVDMTETTEAGIPWFDLAEGDALVIEPFEVLRGIEGMTLQTVQPDGDTSYKVTVPAGLGMRMSSDNRTPDVFDALAGMKSAAHVRLPAEGTTFELEIDHTEALLAAARAAAPGNPVPEDLTITSTWHVTTDIAPFDTSLPTDVIAADSC